MYTSLNFEVVDNSVVLLICEIEYFKMPQVGRPEKIDKHLLTETLIKYKRDIIKDFKVISKNDPIWKRIGTELNNIMTSNALYTYVSCNKFGIRDKLSDRSHTFEIDENNIREDNDREQICDNNGREQDNSKCTTMSDSIISEANECVTNADGVSTFIITMPKTDYDSMIIYKKYRRAEKNRPVSTREYAILQPGIWQHVFNEKIWQATKIPCGFNFKRNKLSSNGASGYACGTCKCGSIIKCVINNSEDLMTKIKCTYVEGQERCGKRYLRNPIRQAVVEKFLGKTATMYRTELAENLIQEGDNVEPPHLYSANVLRVAKHEVIQKNYIDKDPLKALHLMQLGSLKNVIHNIGLNPFFIHYWSNHQLHVYRTYVTDETSCIYIDATGSIIRKIKRLDKTKTKHIFLYNCVANSETSGLFPVCQMLSESHHTNAIHYWLMEWIRSGAPCPREVVCDASRALLTAAVRSFTGYLYIEEYSDACKDSLPTCYIRIDVAHFIKTYANFLKDVRPRVKTFYLSLLGQLILCCNINTAEELLKGILIIARSETEGMTRNNEKTMCETYKLKMKNLITLSTEEMDDPIDSLNQLDDIEEEDNNYNKWKQWAKNIDDDVKKQIIDDEGDRENAHFMPEFADRLMKDMKLIPM